MTATLLCQLGYALTCIPTGSVMHMPTVKSTAVVAIVSFIMAIGLKVLLEYVLDYGPHVACGVLMTAVFLFVLTALSFANPVVASDGRIAFRYPTLAAMAFSELSVELLCRKVKPVFGLRKLDIHEPADVFLLIAGVVGIALCIILPHETALNFDDESHYKESVIYSQGLYTVTNDADSRMFYYFWDNEMGITQKDRAASDTVLNSQDTDGSLYMEANKGAYHPRKTGFMGTAAGLWLGNALGLKATARVVIARIGNMLLYVLIMSLAIRRLKSGKILLFLAGICPYMVYSTACFNYDAWIMAFFCLGYAYYFGALQRPDEVLSAKEKIVMIGSIAIGCLPKIPYAVLLLTLYFMPKSKFEDEKQKKRYYFGLTAAIAAMFIFALMDAFAFTDPIDPRANENGDISGYGQVMFILTHLGVYLKILLGFLFEGYVFNHGYLSTFVYLGSTGTSALILAGMALAALTDSSGFSTGRIGTRAAGILVLLLTLMAAATSMYIVFTPVGAASINGVQTRYMVQLLFPFFMFALNGWFKWNPPRKLYNAVFYLFGTGILVYNIVELVVVPSLC